MARPFSGDNIFGALSHPIRRDILLELRRGERSPGELMSITDISGPSLSTHLQVMRQSGLVTARRDGQRLQYSLKPGALQPVEQFLASMRGGSKSKR